MCHKRLYVSYYMCYQKMSYLKMLQLTYYSEISYMLSGNGSHCYQEMSLTKFLFNEIPAPASTVELKAVEMKSEETTWSSV